MEPKWSQTATQTENLHLGAQVGPQMAPRTPFPGTPRNFFSTSLKKRGSKRDPSGGPMKVGGPKKSVLAKKPCARNVFLKFFVVFLRVAVFIAFYSQNRGEFDGILMFYGVVSLRRSLVKNLCFCMPSPRRFSHLLAFFKTWRPSRCIVFYGVFYNFPFLLFFKN